MGNVRAPAVAGFFYPADQETLSTDVAATSSAKNNAWSPSPKALIARTRGRSILQNCRRSLCRLAR